VPSVPDTTSMIVASCASAVPIWMMASGDAPPKSLEASSCGERSAV
jgi:hypothetical protein